jgi:hypothetical protein
MSGYTVVRRSLVGGRLFICGVAVQKAAARIREIDELVRTATYSGLQNASDDIMSTSRDVVARWKNKPDFGDDFTVTRDRMECLIKPKGSRKVISIFKYVDKGTKGPYLIFPKAPNTHLFFRAGYSAFTQPVALYNKGTGQSFGAFIRSEGVIHPGIKPRLFMETFADKLIPALNVRVQREITVAVA